MKLHSEISVGWILLYACVLLSITGGSAEVPAVKDIPAGNSIIKEKDVHYFQDSSGSVYRKIDAVN